MMDGVFKVNVERFLIGKYFFNSIRYIFVILLHDKVYINSNKKFMSIEKYNIT